MNTLGWQELKVVALAVDDLARAEDFYRSKLGLEPRPQADGDVGFALGGLTILLEPLAGPGGGPDQKAGRHRAVLGEVHEGCPRRDRRGAALPARCPSGSAPGWSNTRP